MRRPVTGTPPVIQLSLRDVRAFRMDPPVVQPNYSYVSPKLEDSAGDTGSG